MVQPGQRLLTATEKMENWIGTKKFVF